MFDNKNFVIGRFANGVLVGIDMSFIDYPIISPEIKKVVVIRHIESLGMISRGTALICFTDGDTAITFMHDNKLSVEFHEIAYVNVSNLDFNLLYLDHAFVRTNVQYEPTDEDLAQIEREIEKGE